MCFKDNPLIMHINFKNIRVLFSNCVISVVCNRLKNDLVGFQQGWPSVKKHAASYQFIKCEPVRLVLVLLVHD